MHDVDAEQLFPRKPVVVEVLDKFLKVVKLEPLDEVDGIPVFYQPAMKNDWKNSELMTELHKLRKVVLFERRKRLWLCGCYARENDCTWGPGIGYASNVVSV